MYLFILFKRLSIRVAKATNYDPVVSVITVFLFYLPFNLIEYMLENLIWGEGFMHFMDPIFVTLFAVFAASCVDACSGKPGTKIVYSFNIPEKENNNDQ